MSNTRALAIKLTWQCNQLTQQQGLIKQQLAITEEILREQQQKIFSACIMPSFILPEQEMARSHFITCSQAQQDEAQIKKTDLLAEQMKLMSQQRRLNTELKMLEKYVENQIKQANQQTLALEQKNRDEWILQRRGTT